MTVFDSQAALLHATAEKIFTDQVRASAREIARESNQDPALPPESEQEVFEFLLSRSPSDASFQSGWQMALEQAAAHHLGTTDIDAWDHPVVLRVAEQLGVQSVLERVREFEQDPERMAAARARHETRVGMPGNYVGPPPYPPPVLAGPGGIAFEARHLHGHPRLVPRMGGLILRMDEEGAHITAPGVYAEVGWGKVRDLIVEGEERRRLLGKRRSFLHLATPEGGAAFEIRGWLPEPLRQVLAPVRLWLRPHGSTNGSLDPAGDSRAAERELEELHARVGTSAAVLAETKRRIEAAAEDVARAEGKPFNQALRDCYGVALREHVEIVTSERVDGRRSTSRSTTFVLFDNPFDGSFLGFDA